MLALLFLIIVGFMLFALGLGFLLAFLAWAFGRLAALPAWAKMVLAAVALASLGLFIALFPTVAGWTFFIALILAAGSVMPYAAASDAKGKAKRKALMAASRSIDPVPFAGPLTPRP